MMTKLKSLMLSTLLIALATAPAGEVQTRPFHLEGEATWDNLFNAFNPEVGMKFNDGEGVARHLGHFTATGVLFALAAPDAEGNFPVVGAVNFVAANGDELHSTYAGVLNVSGVGVATYEFVGGTGRFDDASGTGLVFAQFDTQGGTQFFDVPMDVEWVGEIAY